MAGTVENVVGGPGTISIGITDMGFTEGGIKYEITENVNPIEVDQCAMPIGFLMDKLEGKLTGSFAESSAEVFTQIFGSSSGCGSSTLNSLQEIVLTGPGPDGSTRTVTVHKGLLKKSTSWDDTRGKQKGYQFEILMAADLDQAEGEQFFIVEDAGQEGG